MAEITKLEPRKRRSAKCPICGRDAEAKFRPFCSKRCADIDLGRWLDGVYRVPTDEQPADEAVGVGVSDEAG